MHFSRCINIKKYTVCYYDNRKQSLFTGAKLTHQVLLVYYSCILVCFIYFMCCFSVTNRWIKLFHYHWLLWTENSISDCTSSKCRPPKSNRLTASHCQLWCCWLHTSPMNPKPPVHYCTQHFLTQYPSVEMMKTINVKGAIDAQISIGAISLVYSSDS